jgi:hypothetical protein
MRKWTGRFLSILLILVMISMFGVIHMLKPSVPQEVKGEKRIILVQNLENEGNKKETDSHYLQILKQLKEKVDGWLKDLNERIERENVARFEVRFLEILRNILEWVKEKIDAKIESSEEKKPEKKERGLFRETHQIIVPFLEIG